MPVCLQERVCKGVPGCQNNIFTGGPWETLSVPPFTQELRDQKAQAPEQSAGLGQQQSNVILETRATSICVLRADPRVPQPLQTWTGLYAGLRMD